MSEVIEIVSTKGPLVHTLNAILNKEAKLFEADWDEMEMDEAIKRSKDILDFRNHIERVNNIDF